ncbi:phospholipid carrier-dependent glycosyltransferase [candidate division CSSED10-310 bacterium]|uniref:Phospholipid carrier-dependent glycosyltransferase n=1 Tax=candidate division CSSED10-310 bacterium TaxID=2855610 RepID=A0ABV6YTE9_UNCC1
MLRNLKKHPTVLAFCLILALYLLTSSGHIYSRDGVAMFFMTEGFSLRGNFSIPYNINTQGGRVGQDGLYYSPYGLGQPLLAAPLFHIGFGLTEETSFKYMASFCVSFFNSFVSALTAAVLMTLLLHLGYSIRCSLLTTLVYCFATLAWPYARFFFSEPLVSLCQLAAFLFILKTGENNEHKKVFYTVLAGFCLGWAVLTRPISALLVPLFFLFLCLVWRRKKDSNLGFLILAFVIPLLLCSLLVGYYNWHRFGDFLDQGYGPLPDGSRQQFDFPFLTGLAIYFFSPGKSMFLFSPVLIISLLFLRAFYHRFRDVCLISVSIYLFYILVYSRWCQIEGGYSWGPRFLLPGLAFMLLPWAELFTKWRQLNKLVQAGAIILLGISLFIQVLGTVINYTEVIEAEPTAYYDVHTGRYRFDFSPLPRHYELFKEAIQGQKRAFKGFERGPEMRKSFYIINLDWTHELDVWFLHLKSDGVPVWLLILFIVPLLALLIAAAILLARIKGSSIIKA